MDWPYSEKFMKEFFNLYATMPSLWDQSSPDYRRSRSRQRDRDITILLDKFKEVEPDATQRSLLKKMGILRSQYKIEKKKSEIQRRPMRKFFKFLSFLPDPLKTKPPDSVKVKIENVKAENPISEDPLDVDLTTDNEIVSSAEYLECKPIVQENHEVHEEVALDRFDHYTKAWISSLQTAPRDQQIIAERIINNILFEAQVGNLSLNSPLEISNVLRRNW